MPATKPAYSTPSAPVSQAPLPVRRPGKSNKAGEWASSLRKLLITRGEKIVFTGCIVGCLVFFGLSLKHLPYSKSPDALKSEATKVLNDLESTKSVASLTKKLPKGPDVKALKSLAEEESDARAYALAPLRIPFQNRQLRRGEPRILSIERLLASTGYGPIAIQGAVPTPTLPRPAVKVEEKPADAAKQDLKRRKKLIEEKKNRGRKAPLAKATKEEKKPPEQPVTPKAPEKEKEKSLLAQAPAGSHMELRNWVCLVAAIPYEAQMNEYQQAFHEALFKSPDRDQPRYALPQIERAEVIGGRRLRWRQVNVIAALEDHATWAADYPESTDARLVDPDLTEPLPPLVSTNYDPAKTGHPQVKVVAVKQPKPVDEKQSTEAKESAHNSSGSKKPPPFIGGLRDKKPAAKETPPSTETKPADARPETDKSPEPAPIEIIRYRLFRFFDFDVEPGKVYRYRVKLVALNPNYEIPVRFLASPQAAEGLFREGAWSAPSPAVAVTEGTRLLAGNVASSDLAAENNPPVNPATDEQDAGMVAPLAKILIHYFDFAASKGANVLVDAGRGSLLNQANVSLAPAEPSTGQPPKKNRAGGGPNEGEPEPMLNVQTDAVVVDLFGGDELPGVRGRNIPGHVLVLDRYGAYKTLLQADDAPTFEKDLPTVVSSSSVGKPASEQARK